MTLCSNLFASCCGSRKTADDQTVLADAEREAVADLLNYLENVMSSAHLDRSLHQLRLTYFAANVYHDEFVPRRCEHETNTEQPQRAETDFFSGDALNALSTLVYSQNIDLQRSASLTFAEITERGMLARWA